MGEPKTDAIIMVLESAWETIYDHAGQCWDTLDMIERQIATLTGETDVQVNNRLAVKCNKGKKP